MNSRYLTLTDDSPEVLKGCLWAFAIGAALIVFMLSIWLGIQRAQILIDRRGRIAAERERDAAYAERNTEVRNLNEQLARTESARMEAANQAQTALAAKVEADGKCALAVAQRDQYEQQVNALRAALARSRN